MEDQVTLDRIKLMHPKVREEVEHLYRAQIVPALTGTMTCRFVQTLRTYQEQADIYAQGRTKLYDAHGNKLGIVTKAKPGYSLHNYGLAIDIALINGPTVSWDNVHDFDKDGKADWMEIINIFKTAGWEWGGEFKSIKDVPHVQKTFGHSVQDLLAKYNAKQFIPGTQYVQI